MFFSGVLLKTPKLFKNAFNKHDFPEPTSPTTAISSPFFISKSTSFNKIVGSVSVLSIPKETFDIEIAFSFVGGMCST